MLLGAQSALHQTDLRMGAADTRHNVTLQFSNLVERFTAAAAPNALNKPG